MKSETYIYTSYMAGVCSSIPFPSPESRRPRPPSRKLYAAPTLTPKSLKSIHKARHICNQSFQRTGVWREQKLANKRLSIKEDSQKYLLFARVEQLSSLQLEVALTPTLKMTLNSTQNRRNRRKFATITSTYIPAHQRNSQTQTKATQNRKEHYMYTCTWHLYT